MIRIGPELLKIDWLQVIGFVLLVAVCWFSWGRLLASALLDYLRRRR